MVKQSMRNDPLNDIYDFIGNCTLDGYKNPTEALEQLSDTVYQIYGCNGILSATYYSRVNGVQFNINSARFGG